MSAVLVSLIENQILLRLSPRILIELAGTKNTFPRAHLQIKATNEKTLNDLLIYECFEKILSIITKFKC